MRSHKHTITIVAMLLALCVVIATALNGQTPAGTPTQPVGQTTEQPAPARDTDRPTEASSSEANTTETAQTVTTVAQHDESAQISGPASDFAAADGSAEATDATNNVAEVQPDTMSTSEEIQRQALAAIPHVEQPKVDENAEYEPNVVLAMVRKGTTAEQFSQAMAEADIQTVEHDGVEAVTDDLMMATLAPNATIDDAIYELESKGVAQGAQPNYVYQIAEEQTPVSADAEPAIVDAAAQDEPAGVADVPKASDEPISLVEQNIDEAQPDAPSAIETQSTSPTAARNALNDTYSSKQWDLDSIDALDAWEFPPLKNATATVGVGVVDNGFNDLHEDLADNIQSTYNATSNESTPVRCPSGTPDPAHGTHVAGIVAATSNNEKGIGGVGFNHLKLSLVSLTSESNPSGISTDDVVRGFGYLIDHKDQYNIRVANMSIGGRVDSLPPNDAILNKIDDAYNAGIVTVASAGNRTMYAEPPYINYPSDYATVVSVINLYNTNKDDPKSVDRRDGSNYNAPRETSKNISAPGTEIFSTYPSDYGEMSGTSMAAPHVAGVVGLMFAVNPTLSADQAKDLLYSNARDIGATGWDETFGHGEVNASAAVRAAANGTIEGPEYLAVGSSATYSLGANYTGWSFSSSDTSVLTVHENGSATAVSTGIANVVASSGNSSISRQVTVLGPIEGNNLVAKDGSVALAIATPDGCGSLAWNWNSSDSNVATVTNGGVVHGQGAGNATITATLVADSSVSLSYDVTVYDALKDSAYVPTGSTTALTPDKTGFTTPQISWSSTNTQVATVDTNGTVTASSVGGTVVNCTITEGDKSATNVWCVYVCGPIEGDSSVGIGQSTQLTVAGINSMPEELQTGWTWSLGSGSSSEVATVSEDGVVTGHTLGTVTVTATKEQMSLSHGVQVTKATPISLANAKVTIPRQTYSGQKLTPVPVVTLNGTTLVAGVDYDVADQDIFDAGRYTVTIQGKGAYQGTTSGVLVVEPKKLAPPKAKTDLVYNGSLQAGVPESADYTLYNYRGVDADNYTTTVEIKDKDKVNTCWEDSSDDDKTIVYKTSCSVEWSIAPRSASEVSVAIPGSYVYNGSAHTPKPTVTWNGETLDPDDDYTVSYANNVNAGTATVTITCEHGNFKGTKTATFSIEPAPSSVGTVSAADVKDSLDPANVVLTRTDTSLPGRLAITETELAYGTNTYHWTFTPDDANHKPAAGTVEVTVTGHEWGAPTYTWAEGDASCTAKRVCANNPTHVEEETVVPTRTVVAEPTTEAEGKATLTAEFTNAAFETQSKEVTLPKLTAPGAIDSSVAMEGDGPAAQMTVPEGLIESLLTDEEKELVADGTNASLVATVKWLGTGEVPEDDLALLTKDNEAKKVSLGWETYLSIDLRVRVGASERRITKTDKPIAFEIKLDPEGKDAVSKGLAQAIADGKVDGAITVRRVHEGAVAAVGSAKKGEAITFESDRFSTYALGSATAAKGDSPAPSDQKASSSSSTTTESSTATKLASTSDGTLPAASVAIVGMVVLAAAILRRRIHAQ